MTVVYNLKNIKNNELNELYKNKNIDEKMLNSLKLTKKNDNEFSIIKYDKNYLSEDMIKHTGVFRSVVCKNDKIVSFSPPKSEKYDIFVKENNAEDCYAEEFVEGTMINVFYDEDEDGWEISTKSKVGGKVMFFNNGDYSYNNTFRYKFLEACVKVNFDFNMLSKKYCYSFVMQHSKNRIVIPVEEESLYLIKVYEIDNDNYGVKEVDKDMVKEDLKDSHIKYPERYEIGSYDELKEKYGNMNIDYRIMGITIYNKDGIRTKIRNPNYEDVRKLRGNQPKLQYQYLHLRKAGNVKKYLQYFPEAKSHFNNYRDQVHRFTNMLYTNYVSCYIKKEFPLIKFQEQYRTHMFNIHQLYLTKYKLDKKYITKAIVVEYVNTMESQLLMYSLNFSMRKKYLTEVTNNK